MLILFSSLIFYTLAINVRSDVSILGLRPVDSSVSVDDEGRLIVFAGRNIQLVVFGSGIYNSTKVSFSDESNKDGSCVRKRPSLPRNAIATTNSGSFVITEYFEKADSWFLCIDDGKGVLTPIDSSYSNVVVIEDGKAGWQIGIQVLVICILLTLSGLFSGLNLGLMALNPEELQVVKNVGSEKEKNYAAKILPLRKHGNFLLCTLLLGNVIVNTSATIFLDNLTGSGLTAVFGSAAGIVVFGEIVPQSVCTRHGLAVGAKTIWLTKFFMLITIFVSWPLSKLLDCIFGEEIGQRNNRDKFVEMAKMAQQKGDEHFDPNTVAIIDGAFQLKEKCVKDVMTPIDKVFMIDYNERLTFDLISKISEKGFTRIPVWRKEESNIVGIIFVKDLIFIDPADNMPIKAICDHTNHQLMITYEDQTLDVMLAEFKTGSSHMAIVQKPISIPGKDPYYEITGVITLEDVIEEMIGSEIIDETDYFVDNKGRQRANKHRKMDFKAFLNQPEATAFPPQLKLACFQYLHSEIEAFGASKVHSSVLKKLLECNVLFEIKLDTAVNDGSHVLYRKNVPSDYFILILEGRTTVSVGKDNITFEAGPFHYFGESVLAPIASSISTSGMMQTQNGGSPTGIATEEDSNARGVAPGVKSRANSVLVQESNFSTSKLNIPAHKDPIFMPDFTVTATSNLVIFKIKQKHYMAAVKTSQLIYEQQSSERSDILNSGLDDADSKLESVERMLSDELSKVDAQEKGLSTITGSLPLSRCSGDKVASNESIVDKKGNLNDGAAGSPPAAVRFAESALAENGRLKTTDAQSTKSKGDKNTKDSEEQPLLDVTATTDENDVKICIPGARQFKAV